MGSRHGHLHAFLREARPSQAEWEQAIGFLTAIGRKCDDHRQEFILFSDVLGVSMLVETMDSRGRPAATASTVLGPFHVVSSPLRELGDSIDPRRGRAVPGRGPCDRPDGAPVPGARIDVWQADGNGFYDVQVPDRQPLGDGRGLFTTDADGRYRFRTSCPRTTRSPDGPVGRAPAATGATPTARRTSTSSSAARAPPGHHPPVHRAAAPTSTTTRSSGSSRA